MAARDRAVHLLKHYFGTVAERSGRALDSDCFIEIEDIVDAILEAADDAAAARVRDVQEQIDTPDWRHRR